MTTFTIPTIFTAVNKFNNPMTAMKGSLVDFASRSEIAMARMERSVRRVFSPLTNLRNMMNSVGFYIGIYTFIRWIRKAYDTIANFEQAQIDISAVTGKSVQQNRALADQARILAVRYGEAASSVSHMQLNLIKLGFAEDNVLRMTEAVMTSSIALKAAPEEFSKRLGAILQAFKLPSSTSQAIGDLLAKAADLSALDWSDLSTMLPTAMASASIAFGVKEGDVQGNINAFKRLLTLFAMVRNAQVHVASGATGVKNMLVDAGIVGKTYEEMLQKVISSPNRLKKAWKLFGRRTLVSALPLAEAQNLGSIEDFMNKLTESAGGYATTVATKRMDSIQGKARLVTRAYEEFILSVDSGNGPISTAIKNFFDISRVIFYTESNSEAARQALAGFSSQIKEAAQSFINIISALWTFIKLMIFLKVTLLASRAVMLGLTAAQWLWNISLLASRGGVLAYFRSVGVLLKSLLVYNVLTRQLAIGQTLLNIAMYASPLIIFAVGALAVVGIMKLMGSYIDRLTMGFTDLGESAMSANSSVSTFFQNQNDLARYDEVYRSLNPDIAKAIDEQDRMNAIYKKSVTGVPFAQRIEEGVSKREMEKIYPRLGSSSEPESFRKSQSSMTIFIDDKAGKVSDVRTSGDIKPKISSTFSMFEVENGF